jgi:hypothetical protein
MRKEMKVEGRKKNIRSKEEGRKKVKTRIEQEYNKN